MKIGISFRAATHLDVDFLLELRKLSMDQHLNVAGLFMSDGQHMDRINEFFEDSLIILVNRKAVGLLKLALLQHSLHIRQFQLMPEFQGLGIGKKVLGMVKKKAVKLKRPITLNVLLKNKALTLYRRSGFKVIGENELEYQMKCSQEDCASN
ncbi:MAG: GNAT family N-acetyltransferase [Alteromonadaceae bacterium]|nr:GNAT family N-acetyltransferase [Alteromonadaceae bacterium]